MSGKAILRRQCKRAMRQLIVRFGYRETDFEVPTTKDNNMDVLPGTPIYWWSTDYESSECDCTTALDQYRGIMSQNRIDWAELMRQNNLRDKYDAMRRFPERFLLAAPGGKQ